jgi:flagellar biosynthesis GTPase FlhF
LMLTWHRRGQLELGYELHCFSCYCTTALNQRRHRSRRRLLKRTVRTHKEQEQEQEQQQEQEQSSKKRKTEDQEDQEEQEEQGKEEEKKQWYAGYFELKKALADYIATKPADYVHPDHMSNPLQEIRRIDNAPVVPYVTLPGTWGARSYRLGSFRASMHKGLHHQECALNDIHKMVRDGYTVRPERERERNSSEILYIGNNLDRE